VRSAPPAGARGRTDAQIREYLAGFDSWDRNDYDADGDFAEPDGYIDHFQAVHAGEDESAGAPSWAIWAHRWAAGQAGRGTTGPASNRLGGVQIGSTGFWIRDYTTEPENGGLGVFAHE
jgi:immune inhibitor A